MSEVTHLEQRDDNSPFTAAFGFFSKKPVKTAEDENQQDSPNEIESRDDGPKHVAFHPSIVSASSGEDLAFDLTKIFVSNHRQEPSRQTSNGEKRDERGILLNAKPGIAAGDNANRPAKEVYTGISRRCRADLLKDDEVSRVSRILKQHRSKFEKKAKETPQVSARIKSYPAPTKNSPAPTKNDFLNELKGKFAANNENQPPIVVTSRWLKESRETEESENSDSDKIESKRTMSPKKYSVSKINEVRSGPAPKSEDFFSELKKWHTDYALRSVEKPNEITVTTPVKSNPEEEKESEQEKKIDESTTKINIRKDEKASKKKKKKFWKLSSLSKRKQKSKSEFDDSDESMKHSNLEMIEEEVTMEERSQEATLNRVLKLKLSTNSDEKLAKSDFADEKSISNESVSEVVVETVVSSQEESSSAYEVQSDERKLEPEGGTPKEDSATSVDRSENVELNDKSYPEELFSEILQADSLLEVAGTLFKKDRASIERIFARFEESSKDLPDEEVDDSLQSVQITESSTIQSTQITESSTIQSTQITESSTIQSAQITESSKEEEEKEESGEESSTEQVGEESFTEQSGDESSSEAAHDGNKNEESVLDDSETEATEQKGDQWFGRISSLFKKEDKADAPVMIVDKTDPPVMVVEVDRYEIDKYQPFAAEEEEDIVTARDDESVPEMRVYRRDYGEASSFDNELREEVDHFLLTQCPCLVDHLNINTTITREEAKLKRLETEHGRKELSWFEMASGLFSPRHYYTDDEGEHTECSAGGVTEKQKNLTRTKRSDISRCSISTDEGAIGVVIPSASTFEDSILTKEDIKKKPSYEKEDMKKKPSYEKEDMKKKPSYEKEDIKKKPSYEKEDIKKKPSYEDILLTLADGTKVIKMTALMDMPKPESQPLVDSPNPESHSCSDSKTDKKNAKNQKKKSRKQVKLGGATLFGNLEPSQKKNKSKKKKMRAQTLF